MSASLPVACQALLGVIAVLLTSCGEAEGDRKSGTSSNPQPGAQPAMGDAMPVDWSKKVLLTGFEPFGARTVNDSWEAVRVLDGQKIAGRRIVTQRLPVVYDAMEVPLREALDREKPEVVISFGEGTEVLRVETLGRNGYHPSKPLDNAKKPPPREQIDPEGPATIANELPTEKILKAWADAKIDARASDDAGGYLCNECLYRLMAAKGHWTGDIARRGFIHVPVTGHARPSGGTFDLETLRRAVRLAVEATLADIDAQPFCILTR